MADVLHRTTKEFRKSVHTPNFPTASWIINPDLSAVASLPVRHWKIVDDTVVAMDAAEMAAADTLVLPGVKINAIVAIRAHEATKIEVGFEWPLGSGRIFSLNTEAKVMWLGFFSTTLLAPAKDPITYPIFVPTKDGLELYSVANRAEVEDIYAELTNTILAVFAGSFQAIGNVNAATTLVGVEAARDTYLAT